MTMCARPRPRRRQTRRARLEQLALGDQLRRKAERLRTALGADGDDDDDDDDDDGGGAGSAGDDSDDDLTRARSSSHDGAAVDSNLGEVRREFATGRPGPTCCQRGWGWGRGTRGTELTVRHKRAAPAGLVTRFAHLWSVARIRSKCRKRVCWHSSLCSGASRSSEPRPRRCWRHCMPTWPARATLTRPTTSLVQQPRPPPGPFTPRL